MRCNTISVLLHVLAGACTLSYKHADDGEECRFKLKRDKRGPEYGYVLLTAPVTEYEHN